MDGPSMNLLTECSLCDRISCACIFFCICVLFDECLSLTPSPHRKPAAAKTSFETFLSQEHHKGDILRYKVSLCRYFICRKLLMYEVVNNSENQS
jgi:hypothetical protein